ncbi:hypothetical protein ABWI07_18865, partial [Actinomadura sp. NPDC000600]
MTYVVAGLVVSVVLLGCAAGPALDLLRRSAVGPGTAVACWTAALAGTSIAAAGAAAAARGAPAGAGPGLLSWGRGRQAPPRRRPPPPDRVLNDA